MLLLLLLGRWANPVVFWGGWVLLNSPLKDPPNFPWTFGPACPGGIGATFQSPEGFGAFSSMIPAPQGAVIQVATAPLWRSWNQALAKSGSVLMSFLEIKSCQ